MIVQKIVFGSSPAERGLHFSSGSLDDRYNASLDISEAGIRTVRPTKISFNRLFSVFFENYWRSIVPYGAVRLTIRYSGSATLNVWRETRREGADSGLRSPVVSIRLPVVEDGVGEHVVDIASDKGPFASSGLLFFDLEGDEPFGFHGGHWSIDKEPVRDVRLAVATCTVDYAKMMPIFFGSLESDSDLVRNLEQIIVVNNKPDSYDPKLVEKYPEVARKLKVVHQDNLGGSGGFTRGILEAESNPRVTHIALLDDDAVLAPGALARARGVLSFCDPSTIIGGQMLDLNRPTTLLASGQFYNVSSVELSNPVLNTELTEDGWQQAFLDRHEGQWNGWWLCIFPREAFKSAGYPVPLFLKWDDVEYGVRTDQKGFGMIAWPGVSVWHEAPDMKPVSWQAYFNTRNGFITKVLRAEDDRAASAGLFRFMVGEFMSVLLTFRYFQARLVIEAMQDFLRGPEALHVRTQEHLAQLRAFEKEFPGFKIGRAGKKARVKPQPRVGGGVVSLLRAIGWNCFRASRVVPLEQTFASRFLNWRDVHGLDAYYVDDPSLPGSYEYRKNSAMARGLLRQFTRLLVKYVRQRRAIVKTWRDDEARLISKRYWVDYLRHNGQTLDLPLDNEAQPPAEAALSPS